MNIAFRADASYKIGSGHVFRCLVLADTFKAQDCNVIFISRLLDGHLIDLIRARGFEVITLGDGVAKNDNTSSIDWLGVSQEGDANETIENLEGRVFDILLVDHYSLDIEWETYIKPYTDSMAVIDDLANRNHNCDFLIDQNFRNENFDCYDSLVPAVCKKLLGLQYAILSPEYEEVRKNSKVRTGIINRVLVYFGGTDWQNMTSLAVKVLSQDEFSFLEVDVVVGSNYPFLLDLEKLISKRPKTNFYQSLPSLARLMSVADIAIGAGGTTLWERMSMGLPAIVISLADNQVRSCESLQKEDLIHYLGNYNDISDSLLTKYLRERICSPEDNYNLSMRISEYVDGFGALRIVQAMEL